MARQPLSRAETKGQRQGADLHQRQGRESVSLLKLLAWPAFFYGLGMAAFLAVYALQLGGFL